MVRTPTATSVQLARAEALGKALTHRGWTSRSEPKDKHPGAVTATVHRRSGIRTLVLTLGGRHGQMFEITAEAGSGPRGQGGRRVRAAKTSWRLTAYDTPIEAVLAAATAAFDDPLDSNPLGSAGWTIEHALVCKNRSGATQYTADAATPWGVRVRATRFTRPDGALIATFYLPTYAPPCEHCTHHGELGDTGGWNITGPGFTAEATAHTPTAVIGAFTRALPGDRQGKPTTTPNEAPVKPRHRAKAIPAAAAVHGAQLTAAVR